jgi:hypothetical protein
VKNPIAQRNNEHVKKIVKLIAKENKERSMTIFAMKTLKAKLCDSAIKLFSSSFNPHKNKLVCLPLPHF